MKILDGTIDTLNGLPYEVNTEGSWVKESDIVDYLCDGSWEFYSNYFDEGTYLKIQNDHGKYQMLYTLIAVHEVFEIIADKKDKGLQEREYERLVFPFIVQLAKIGVQELDGNRPPIEIMEELLMNGDTNWKDS